jgi:hypothetical protein
MPQGKPVLSVACGGSLEGIKTKEPKHEECFVASKGSDGDVSVYCRCPCHQKEKGE